MKTLRIKENTPVRAGHASEPDWRGVSHVVFCITAEDAQAFVSRYRSSFPDIGRLLFFCVGNIPDRRRVRGLATQIKYRKIILAMPDDLLGRVMCIKIALWLKQKDVWLTYLSDGLVEIIYNDKAYLYPEDKISLSAFEKAAGLRFKIRCYRVHRLS